MRLFSYESPLHVLLFTTPHKLGGI